MADLQSCSFHLPGISCAGEIRISEHEDYEKWAIDILVKFRDSEKLQLLTAHRQSGGVRSFSPIYRTPGLNDHLFFAFLKLVAFSIGTIPDNYSISYESDRRSPCTLFPSGRDQSGTAYTFPYLLFHELVDPVYLFLYLTSGNGSTSRTRGTQFNGQCDLQSRERAIFLDHSQIASRFDVSRKDENLVRE